MKNLSVTELAGRLDPKAQRDLNDWLKVLAPLRDTSVENLPRAIAAISESTGLQSRTIRNKYHALRESGPIGLVDTRRLSPQEAWKKGVRITTPISSSAIPPIIDGKAEANRKESAE